MVGYYACGAFIYAPISDDAGGHIVSGKCVRIYVHLYECVYVRTYIGM